MPALAFPFDLPSAADLDFSAARSDVAMSPAPPASISETPEPMLEFDFAFDLGPRARARARTGAIGRGATGGRAPASQPDDALRIDLDATDLGDPFAGFETAAAGAPESTAEPMPVGDATDVAGEGRRHRSAAVEDRLRARPHRLRPRFDVQSDAPAEPVLERLVPSADQTADVVMPPVAAAVPAADDEPFRRVGPLRIGNALFNIFLTEADEQSRRLAAELAEWQAALAQPLGEAPIALAHSLAGNSATVGYTDLSQLARALEHAEARSAAIGHGTADEAQLFVDAADEIRQMLHQFAAGFLRAAPPGCWRGWPSTSKARRCGSTRRRRRPSCRPTCRGPARSRPRRRRSVPSPTPGPPTPSRRRHRTG